MAMVQIGSRQLPVQQAATLREPQSAARRVAEDMFAFRRWAERTAHRVSDYTVSSVMLDAMDCPPVPPTHAALYCPRPAFAALRVGATCCVSGERLPGLVLLRGRAVSVLVLAVCQGEEFAVLTVAPRFAVGQSNFAEIPSGIFDPSGNFVGTAAQELKEEGGLTQLRQEEMQLLTPPHDDGQEGGVYTAPHATDERCEIWLCRREVTPEWLARKRQELVGNRTDGDMMTLLLVPASEAWRHTADARSLSALMLYEARQRAASGGRPP
eukprot:TRINITY_DN60323_c0_g1_i1.p1 TRINITY_DN60323_c0_g1~~TRINITY_DN60323_c0_g1_i1.p1  ORF type:complete len:268 (+),score=70.55 TRINITY_DN60323_c0_g1_i1:140-943(+)